jgi:hypothetical protein
MTTIEIADLNSTPREERPTYEWTQRLCWPRHELLPPFFAPSRGLGPWISAEDDAKRVRDILRGDGWTVSQRKSHGDTITLMACRKVGER